MLESIIFLTFWVIVITAAFKVFRLSLSLVAWLILLGILLTFIV